MSKQFLPLPSTVHSCEGGPLEKKWLCVTSFPWWMGKVNIEAVCISLPSNIMGKYINQLLVHVEVVGGYA